LAGSNNGLFFGNVPNRSNVMSAYQVDLFRIPMRGPGDVSGLTALIVEGQIDPRDIVAILGKTEGNGCVNDFTREYASHIMATTLASHLDCTAEEIASRVALVMSGGTEGVLSPHMSVFTRRAVAAKTGSEKRLAIGVAHTRDFLPEEIGRQAQIDETAKAVKQAMIDAGIDDVADVHFVQIKCPLLTAERIEAAKSRGYATVTQDTYASMGYSRGASALGIAAGLGEITQAQAVESAVLSDWTLYSTVASTSAGIELFGNAIVVMGNARTAVGDKVIGHAVMQDAIDLRGVMDAFNHVGIDDQALFSDAVATRVVNVFAKAEPSPNGVVRGARHTMMDDSDINCTRHARAAVGGVIASVAGTGAVYVSGGAEHQGPAGGGPIAVVAKVANTFEGEK
jgi:cyanuric acid amidohydrolase